MSTAASIRTIREAHACNCVGPQNGEPLCPCRMRNVQVKDGRYVEIIDHGPVEPEMDRAIRSVLSGPPHRRHP